jgi:aryl-alcohol dehydrogenase-like predicted oxidoreductase
MSMTPIYGVPDPDEAVATLHHAADIGMNFIDTSDAYGQNGANEELVGRGLKGRRDKFVLATKFGNIRLPDGKPGAKGDPAYVLEACDKSLKRLGTDYIDLYFIHRVDNTVPIEDTVGAMVKLKEQGKICHLGISEAGPATIRRAHKVHKMASLQTEYSLWSRDVEKEILPVCHELGIGFLAYAPLGRGFLTGALTSRTDLEPEDRRNAHPRFQPGNFEANQRLLLALDRMAAAHGCSKAQLALAWVLAQGNDIVPIPGTRQTRYLQQNAGALAVSLSPAELAILAQSFPPGVASGTRYPEAQLKTLGI